MIKKRSLIISILSVFSSMAAFSAQDVFEYKNNDGVVEFTDQRKENEQPEKQFQIKKQTAEQEAQSKEKLAEIMAKDKELDKKIAKENKLKNKRLKEQREAKAKKEQQKSSESNNDNDGYYTRPRRTRPIQLPVQKPKPIAR